jgi:transketolase
LDQHKLYRMAQQNRIKALDMVYAANSGHIGGSFSAMDVITYLFSTRIDFSKEERSRFILSKGHSVPAVYAMLHTLGYIADEELNTFRMLNSRLQGHTNVLYLPQTDMTTGLLGQGLSCGVGMALGKRLKRDTEHCVYVMLGDGELHEGQNWEAMMEAAHYHLENLVLIIDRNTMCSHQKVEAAMSIEPLAEKVRAFGWHVEEMDGHDFADIDRAFQSLDAVKDTPCCLISHTKKGAGVSFMENNGKWHRSIPTEAEYRAARAELEATLQTL